MGASEAEAKIWCGKFPMGKYDMVGMLRIDVCKLMIDKGRVYGSSDFVWGTKK